MSALLDDKGAPLFGRLTATIELLHWDFEDLTSVYRAHDIEDPYQWLTLWSFFEGVPKFYRDAFDQGLFSVPRDNFPQAWLSVVKPARDTSRMRPLAKAIERAMPRCFGHEGFAFEKLIRQLHIECSRKGLGDFSLTSIELGFWNRARNVDNNIEIDIVALNADERRVRFGSCKRNATAHDGASLAKFEAHIERFRSTKEGRRVKGWTVEKALFSPVFTTVEKGAFFDKGYECRDLQWYAELF